MTSIDNSIKCYQLTNCEDSFNVVYEKFAPKAFAVAKKQATDFGLNYSDVESETNFAILKAIKTYDLRGGFEPYLIKLVKFYATNVGRSAKRQLSHDQHAILEESSPYGNPEQSAIKKEQRQLLELLTASADPKSRQALEAYAASYSPRDDEYSFRDAAKRIGSSDKTVKSRIEKISAARQHISLSDYITA